MGQPNLSKFNHHRTISWGSSLWVVIKTDIIVFTVQRDAGEDAGEDVGRAPSLGSADLPRIPSPDLDEPTPGDDVPSPEAANFDSPAPDILAWFTPSFFSILKCKTDEMKTAALRFRDIVSFKGHPLQGRCKVCPVADNSW